MLDEHSKPGLMVGISLANPEGTGLFFAFQGSTGDRFELNEVSYEIIRRLDGTRSLSVIVSEIEAEFDGAEDVLQDALALVRELINEQLVTLDLRGDSVEGESNA